MKLRKVWFITRPERDPRFHMEAMQAIKSSLNDFTVVWAGNRAAHKDYERELGSIGIKRKNVSADGSGGRTWAAMMRTFSYCYQNDDGYLVPTKVGAALIRGEKVFENIKKQILTLQIPNSYFMEKGFRPKYEDGFRIRPARFLIRLACLDILDFYITKEEIVFFAMTAKRDDQLIETAEEIRKFRNASNQDKQLMKQVTASDFDHRDRSDKGARDFESAHSDVAHTFMLICDYTGLAVYYRGDALRIKPDNVREVVKELSALEQRYPFNNRYMISLQRMAENSGLDVDSYKGRSLGREKPVASNRIKSETKIKKLFEAYPVPAALSKEDLMDILKRELPIRDAEKIVFEIQDTSYLFSGMNSDFIDNYLSEKDNLAFEDKTGEILRAIGFEVVMRPKHGTGAATEIEILLKYGRNQCGIVDTKNYGIKFHLSAQLASHMASEYIPNYDGYDGRSVDFFGYVTAADFSGEKNLEKITGLADKYTGRTIKGFMVTARVLLAFLDYCIENELTEQERVNLFITAVRGRGFRSIGQILKEIN